MGACVEFFLYCNFGIGIFLHWTISFVVKLFSKPKSKTKHCLKSR